MGRLHALEALGTILMNEQERSSQCIAVESLQPKQHGALRKTLRQTVTLQKILRQCMTSSSNIYLRVAHHAHCSRHVSKLR